MQNTQHDFQLYGDGMEMSCLLHNLRETEAQVFCPISPNVNWNNQSNWIRTRRLFRPIFQSTHLSTVSSVLGSSPPFSGNYLNCGTAILSFGLWSSKVSSLFHDTSGYGVFSVTTLQGRTNKHLSLVSAYITVQKGSDIGSESLYAQQVLIYEKQCIKNRKPTDKSFCPRINAIKILNNLIQDLQQKQHAIILMLDANQTLGECFKGDKLKQHTVEWLRLQRGMDDPFIQFMGHRPNSTTVTPCRDIDWVLTSGITISNITTLHPNFPACSDHLGIIMDVDIASFFQPLIQTFNRILLAC